MAETNTENDGGKVSRLAGFRNWLRFFGNRSQIETNSVQPQALKMNPHSGLYKFIEQIGASDSIERRTIEYPLEVLYGDYKAIISKLEVQDDLKSKISDAFDDGNLGVILKVIINASKNFRKDIRKFRLNNQLNARLESFVIGGDSTSPEAFNKKHWIKQVATWDQLISGTGKEPSLDVFQKEMQTSNLDPTLPPLQK